MEEKGENRLPKGERGRETTVQELLQNGTGALLGDKTGGVSNGVGHGAVKTVARIATALPLAPAALHRRRRRIAVGRIIPLVVGDIDHTSHRPHLLDIVDVTE